MDAYADTHTHTTTNLYLDKPFTYIQTKWLTMMYSSGICQICNTPEGNTHSYYLNRFYDGDNKFGHYTCGKTECKSFIQKYLKKIYNEIYKTKQWQKILNLYANNIFIKVTRSNGDIENDWQISDFSDKKKVSLSLSVLYSILCNKKQGEVQNEEDQNGKSHIGFVILPSDIWEYIYSLCLQSYSKDINIELIYENETTMNTKIRVSKDHDLYKKIDIDMI